MNRPQPWRECVSRVPRAPAWLAPAWLAPTWLAPAWHTPVWLALLWAGLALGCETARPEPTTILLVEIPTSGPQVRVEILDAHHVSFEGKAVPAEALILEMRQRVRAAAGQSERLPSVQLVARQKDDPATGNALARLVQALGAAGVRTIWIGEQD